jgi:uncharacterized membrane protein
LFTGNAEIKLRGLDLNKGIYLLNKWEKISKRFKQELNGRAALSLFQGVFVYLFVSYLFAGTEFYRIIHWSIGQSDALYAFFTFNIVWILSTFASEILNSWFKQIVYQGIAGGITGSFVKEEIKSSISICCATLLFYTLLVLLSTISDVSMIFLFLIKGILISVVGGIIGIRFYKEVSTEYVMNDE